MSELEKLEAAFKGRRRRPLKAATIIIIIIVIMLWHAELLQIFFGPGSGPATPTAKPGPAPPATFQT